MEMMKSKPLGSVDNEKKAHVNFSLKQSRLLVCCSGCIYCQIITQHETFPSLTDYSHHKSLMHVQKHNLY